MRRQHTFSQRGISLAESLLTLALVMLLAAQAAPHFSAWFERLTLTATTNQIITLLRHGQQLAITRQSPIAATLVTGNPWCLALTDTDSCDCTVSRNCQVAGIEYRLPDAAETLDLTSNRFSARQPLVFDGLAGMSYDSAGTLILSGRQSIAKIIISPLGRVRACAVQGSLNGLPPC